MSIDSTTGLAKSPTVSAHSLQISEHAALRRHQVETDTDASAGWREEYGFQGVGGDAR